jgi:hypothetical protein
MALDLLRRPQPILGILLVVAGWFAAHQAGSDGIYDQCARGGSYVIVVSLIGLLVTAAGGLYCYLATRGGGSGRRFFGLTGALLGVLAGFATVLQIVAGFIIPACAV